MNRRVAIYARVSTEHEAQVSALENQIQYYDEYMARFPEWELVERYIDEGLSATSTAKRVNYLRMVEDAKAGKFDLLITREVSRLARNILDAIEQTRMLKKLGVEVIFTEDGISTMDDDDGELKLSIMAILAQNESKKISTRVKAGQKISFLNGVYYGTGNILGYDKVGKEMVINKEQAKTVRRIYDLALEGYGVQSIHFILEQEGYKTATGKDHWQISVILRVLRNKFYYGVIEYNKQYVPDYLEQKKVNNHGEVERTIVQGTHEPIVTKEEFDRVQKLIADRTMEIDGKHVGRPLSDNVWVRKLRCGICRHTFSRRVNYVTKDGSKSYLFQCYKQTQTGTVQTRINKGLSTEGICTCKSFPEWKMWIQADFIFRNVVSHKQEIYEDAIAMMDDLKSKCFDFTKANDAAQKNDELTAKLKSKIEAYADMCADGDISKEYFRKKKAEIEKQIERLDKETVNLNNKISENADVIERERRLGLLADFISMKAFDKDAPIPETVIEEYVREIETDGVTFTWKLTPKSDGEPEVLPLCVTGTKRNHEIKTTCNTDCGTGSDRG